VRDTVHDLLSKGQKRILLNLGGVNYIDSSVRRTVSAFTLLKAGGERQTAEPDQEDPRPSAITKLYTVFD